MINVPNFRDFCESACIKLWGEPDKRDHKELRWDGHDAYSARTFSIQKKAWYDHGQERGGSTLDLVAYIKSQPKQQLRGATFFATWAEAHKMDLVPDPPPTKTNGGGGPILATYPYTGEDGALLFEVVRFDTADRDQRFCQRRLDGNGGWIWNVKGVRNRLLYRVRALIDAGKAGQRVLICEGEHDANTAAALGFSATTNPGGVNKWSNEYDEFFRGADVVIVSDNDPQSKDAKTGAPQFHPNGRPIHRGQDHAARVAKHMRKVAAHVRTVMFPQKDLSAWVEAGGTRAALEALIEAAPDQIEQPESKIADPTESDREEILAELNRDNAVVLDSARTMVLRFEEVSHEAGGERYTYRLPTFLRFEDFRNFYLNRYIDVGDDKVSIGRSWLGHPDRRQYHGVVFVPAGEPIINGRLNLWRGWGVEPKRGDWPLLRQHMFEVLAARNDDVDRYNLNWLAWTVQHPAEQAEVALVFLGGIGTGKGTLGKAMCRIFGQHARHLSSPEHLTGRFNAHLRQCCFLFGDECYGPKDKSAEGTLKRLITEPTLQIEAKRRDIVEEPNRLHVMLASNNEWVIPAGAHERRYAVQEVADNHRQDANWFGPIYQEMRSGGLQAMLYDLLNYDLGDWHPRQIVRTPALAKQQEESLSPLDQWWLELLQTGVLEGASKVAPNEAISNHWEEEITETDGYGGQRKRTVRREGLYDQARRISPKLKGVSDTALGLYLRDPQRGCTNAWVRRHRGWQFQPLNQCRERWEARFPETVWRDQETTKWTFAGD